MTVIVYVDDRMGMLFFGRRQSSDRVLRARIAELSKGNRLYMNGYSAKQFEGMDMPQMVISETFLDDASRNDFCFVENLPLLPHKQNIQRVILYRWNRHYPADTHFDLPLSAFRLIETSEFPGYSHEKITEEIYEL